MNNKLNQLGEQILLFDGAMGTMLQERGMRAGQIPELLNILDPDMIRDIHKAYIDAGADIITTNTFGANSYKLSGTRYTAPDIVKAAVSLAREAAEGTDALVALDLGPIGKMMKPIGLMDFDEAYGLFQEIAAAGASAGADLIIIETMADLGEMRAAILAARENTGLPIFATMTFSEDGNTLSGTSPEIMAISLDALGVDCLGVNCSLGPQELMPIVKRILESTNTPVMVQANAGIPVTEHGVSTYPVSAGEYQNYAEEFAALGVSVMGGCCGTTPEYIQNLKSARAHFVKRPLKTLGRYVASAQKRVALDGKVTLIGERINPSGNKALKAEFLEGNPLAAVKTAFEQVQQGAEILDVNTSLPQINESEYMNAIIDGVSGLVDAPLQFDSTKPEVLESALRRYAGVAIVNSVNGKQASMDTIYPLAAKYGAYVVALCLDDAGIPEDAAGRTKVAQKLISEANKHGIDEGRLLIDTLVLTASAQQKAVMETLGAMRWIKANTRALTTLGLSNVSYGLPYRALINRTYFAMALTSGLDSVIINPGAEGIVDTLKAFNVLAGIDDGAVDYIAYNSKETGEVKNEPKKAGEPRSFKDMLLEGDSKGTAETTSVLLEKENPLAVVDHYIIPALDEIGRLFEEKTIFLPQLIRAAETAGIAFDAIKQKLLLSNEKLEPKGTIVMATVQGDIHDIGKNLAKVVLENYGYQIIDLGKDVPVQAIVDIVKEQNVKLVGLSALMTTTVVSMEETIKALKETSPETKILVGGAVLTESYAKHIGADFYCKDARADVAIAQAVFEKKI